jgi:hypothetical protein
VAVLKSVAAVEAKVREYHGNLAAVGRHFGVTRQSVHDYVAKHPTLRAAVRDCREAMKDHAESALHKAILNSEPWAITFYLRTQARDRGYVERHEHTGVLSDAELDRAIEAELAKLAARRPAAPPGAAANGPPPA